MYNLLFSLLLAAGMFASCASGSGASGPDAGLAYCRRQAEKALPALHRADRLPYTIAAGDTGRTWSCSAIEGWTSGFWPGILWYLYEDAADTLLRKQAERFSSALLPLAARPAANHDLGFMLYCSLGNGYRLTGNPVYRDVLLRAADSLATLYNPVAGTICSWPYMRRSKQWPHNTIIDNMMNLELLFWAAKHGGSPCLYEIAARHARVTSRNQFRPDHTVCHVVVYDTVTGRPLQRLTHQGYSDVSVWARGQAWAVYGFTLCYRETGDSLFLQTACRAADAYLARLPADYVPYWDFDAPDIPHAPRDASAAAVTASALLELCGFVSDNGVAARYRDAALRMLESLSGSGYRSGDANPSFLLHSTGHYPAGREIDASLIYADYYYLEALMRWKKMQRPAPSL